MTTRAAWRRWLAAHHDSEREVWLVFFKAHVGKPGIAYEEAVEEAICFGWVDSLVKRLDDERYTRKFTPRTARSSWSESNLRRLAKVVREGRMTPAGLAVAAPALATAPAAPAAVRPTAEPILAAELQEELERDARARAAFAALAPSHRRLYVRWIMDAKKAETRRRRLAEAVGRLAAGRKLGLK